MYIIPNEAFGVDYSKAEFKTFCHVGYNGSGEFSDLYDYDGFKALCVNLPNGALVFSSVYKAILENKAHYLGFGTGREYFEIQWD